MGGRYSDWYMSNHFDLILYYKEFVRQHPDVGRAYLWLMDHLLDAGRIDEAESYLEIYRNIDSTFRTLWYQGLILWYKGNHSEAFECWDKMQSQFPDDWMVYLIMGDIMEKNGKYEKAKSYYRQGITCQNAPTYCDTYESIAQVCELQGKTQEAIAVLKEELEVQKIQWNVTSGETADVIHRWIERLEYSLI